MTQNGMQPIFFKKEIPTPLCSCGKKATHRVYQTATDAPCGDFCKRHADRFITYYNNKAILAQDKIINERLGNK